MGDLIQFDDKRTKILSDSICKGFNNEELEFFVMICKRTGLDPFARQIYATKQWDKNLGRDVIRTQVSVDGLRTVAERSEKYEGQTKAEWCGLDGKWVDVWLKKEYPAAARVGVYKKGHREATYAVATWASYVQMVKGEVGYMWKKMPDLMLGKCAESLALRKAFPNDLSGLYSTEEMAQSENLLPEPKPLPPPPEEPKALPTSTPHWGPPIGDGTGIGNLRNATPLDLTDDSFDPAKYIVPGGKYVGRLVKDIPEMELRKYLKDLAELEKTNTKPFSGKTKETMENMQSFLNTMS